MESKGPELSVYITEVQSTNILLTERVVRIKEYWPEVEAVWTEHSEVCTKTTEGRYSPVRLELHVAMIVFSWKLL